MITRTTWIVNSQGLSFYWHGLSLEVDMLGSQVRKIRTGLICSLFRAGWWEEALEQPLNLGRQTPILPTQTIAHNAEIQSQAVIATLLGARHSVGGLSPIRSQWFFNHYSHIFF